MQASSSRRTVASAQDGASTAEFLIVAPVLLFLGFGAVQLGLIRHGRTILDYATFEAARSGAVNHALPEPMRRELAVRLAPMQGGDGSAAKAAEAIARSVLDLTSPLGPDGLPRPMTTIERLSPTPAAFADWGVHDPVSGRTVIPNSHLRHRHAGEASGASGTSLRDANILEIEVTHGFELKIPVVRRVLTTALAVVDPENAAWYAANRLPLSSVATVRMQSDAWRIEDEPIGSVAPERGEAVGPNDGVAPPGDAPAETGDGGIAGSDGADGESDGGVAGADRGEGGDDGSTIAGEVCGEHGIGGLPAPVSESDYLGGSCGIGADAYTPTSLPDIPGSGDGSPASLDMADC